MVVVTVMTTTGGWKALHPPQHLAPAVLPVQTVSDKSEKKSGSESKKRYVCAPFSRALLGCCFLGFFCFFFWRSPRARLAWGGWTTGHP